MPNELRVLLTGFEKFGGSARNPSGDAATHLSNRVVIAGARKGRITGRVLPVLWDVADIELRRHLSAVRPHIAICTGMAGAFIEIEEKATDCKDYAADNQDRYPSGGAHAATRSLPTTLPVDRILAVLNATSDPDLTVVPSSDAGAYLCEDVFFTLMEAQAQALRIFRMRNASPGTSRSPRQRLSTGWPLVRAGFIHVPSDTYVDDSTDQHRIEDALVKAINVTIDSLTQEEYRLCIDN